MNTNKEADILIECSLQGYYGCINCKYMYYNKCLLTTNYKKDDLDYLKAMIDLNEEFHL
jgi:hypothetical protein